MKKILCLVMTAIIVIAMNCTALAASKDIVSEAGQKVPDFTINLTDGTSTTLYTLLEDKDLVVFNIFATWCAPCEYEFPDMNKVYQENSGRMVMLSVSGDPEDTMEMLADYKASHNLTFPMGLIGDAQADELFNVPGYPSTYFIRHDGTVGFIKIGAFMEEGEFGEKVDTFLAEDYDGQILPTEEAHSIWPTLFAFLAAATVLLVIGRWRLFMKAGIPGWHSIVPFLSTYSEYSLGWNGWFGILSNVCMIAAPMILLFAEADWASLLSRALFVVCFVLRFLESMKLSKAFGKGTGTGILLAIFKSVGRCILSFTKAEYNRQAA